MEDAYAFIVGNAKQGLYLVLILSAPPVLSALVVGLFVSIMQATTQVQEQTLTFVPKLVAIVLVLILMGELGFSYVQQFTMSVLENFPRYIR